MSRHPLQSKGLASLTRRARNFATIGPSPSPRHHRARYELRTLAGTVLQSCDDAGPLVRHLGEKRGCCVVRCRDSVVVARSPVAEELESA
jgi:hypothetical protein